ncbi:hypothetical protein GCM10011591_38890 [Nocardia camponoti]|uniref:Uncharacterized protein n=1 Tax=Nocardia camponoti TaxID=1616106 RepID=A0A917QR10_9NOCA|nr:hypothetical protein GCM10011591_38890 [Nocardia camponoti]
MLRVNEDPATCFGTVSAAVGGVEFKAARSGPVIWPSMPGTTFRSASALVSQVPGTANVITSEQSVAVGAGSGSAQAGTEAADVSTTASITVHADRRPIVAADITAPVPAQR